MYLCTKICICIYVYVYIYMYTFYSPTNLGVTACGDATLQIQYTHICTLQRIRHVRKANCAPSVSYYITPIYRTTIRTHELRSHGLRRQNTTRP